MRENKKANQYLEKSIDAKNTSNEWFNSLLLWQSKYGKSKSSANFKFFQFQKLQETNTASPFDCYHQY